MPVTGINAEKTNRPYFPGLAAPFFVFGAVDGVRTLGIVAGTAPVPLAGTAQDNVHAEHQFDVNNEALPGAGLIVLHST